MSSHIWALLSFLTIHTLLKPNLTLQTHQWGLSTYLKIKILIFRKRDKEKNKNPNLPGKKQISKTQIRNLNTTIYQHFWLSVGNCVIKTVLDFLNHGKVSPKFNETHVVPILKTKNPTKVTEYRSIGLCNVVYKLAPLVIDLGKYYHLLSVILKVHLCMEG